MKNILLLISVLFLTTCGNINPSDSSKKENNFDWLLGSWERLNDPAGKKTFEIWDKKSEEEYIGLGYTLAKMDTIFKENMRLIKMDGKWNLEVTGVNPTPTYFVFTNQAENSFVCENEKNDFPKKIEYQLKDKRVEAKISGGKMEVEFSFKRITIE